MSIANKSASLFKYWRNGSVVKRHFGMPMRFPVKSYDDMVVPSGSWQAYNDKILAANNGILISGAIAFVITAIGTFYFLRMNRYAPKPRSNTEEGLSFLNPDQNALNVLLRGE
ncbi:hypothetical protein Ciccas_004398 [Cichlidogyrus casuarinus]|uniref:Deltamethrin resistance protein prag01 domain-containing protein n=1 Tax=Cichlidogyrus casuarinus TaxID=1844966 RepID=A0ABD2QBM7_9PLAT